jgi:hypothetical protein
MIGVNGSPLSSTIVMKKRWFGSLVLVAITLLSAGNVQAQSTDSAENQAYIQKSVNETVEYLDAKCSGFKLQLDFVETGIDYSQNPTLGTPTTTDRVTAPLYGIAQICERGDVAANSLKRKFNAIRLKQGGSNSARLNGQTLELTFAASSKQPFGELKELFATQISKL